MDRRWTSPGASPQVHHGPVATAMGGDVELDVAGALWAFPACVAGMGWGVAGGDGARGGWLGLAGLTPVSYASVQRGRGRKGRALASSSP